FATPYSVTAGTDYAMVIYTIGGSASAYYTVGYNSAGGYTSGRECSSTDAGSNWTGSDTTDLYFWTYILDSIGNVPGSTVYATTSRSDITTAGDYDFTFATPYSVTSGTKYAIVIYTSLGDGSNYYTVAYNSAGGYASGRECSSTDGGTNWTGSDTTDLYFKTYFRESLGNIPGSTVHATTSRSDITTAGDYDFTFGTPYSVTSGTDYAIVIYTSLGDGSNYYTAAYNSAGGYASGRECSSTDAGSNWTGSDSTDLYFKTYIREYLGKLPGSTVYATTSRGDITTVGDYDFTFATPYSVTSGTEYAIVIYTSLGDGSNHYTVAYNSAGGYANGRECSSTDGGSNWAGSDTTDLYFMTYVTESLGDVPGSTVYATTSRSDITTAGDYDFTFGTPYSVASGTDYAIVIYTSLGDASNYYTVAYNSAGGYASGRECSSTDAGSNWTGSDTTDLYFMTYIRESLGDVPGSTVHATTSRSDVDLAGEYDFTFGTPYSVTAGTDYAIVVRTPAGSATKYYNVSYRASDVYANGRECSSTDAGVNWTGSDGTDLYFKTYVTQSIGNTPGSTVYATTSRSDITTASDYDFVFGTPYTIASGTDYAIVVYTSLGDASNYYTVAYNSAGGYGSGGECSSTDAGSNWTGSDSTDLYFKTYIRESLGDVPGSTVYATTSRSDITTVGDYDFVFSTPYVIASGTDYAIVVYTSGGDASNYYTVAYNSAGGYTNGRECSSTDAGSNWTGSDTTDLYFKTYIRVSLGNVPGSTVYATTSRGDINGEGEYDFTFTTPYAITSGTDYAIVVYTSLGDASNYYTVAYNSAGGYGSGRECSSADGGSAWTGSDTTDLYFKTYLNCTLDQSQTSYSGDREVYGDNWRSQIFQTGLSGKLSKVTLMASKIGVPVTDLVVELRDAIQVDEEYLDQSQTSQNGILSTYGDNWSGQTFTAGMSGSLTRITLHVAKDGSPPNDLIVELRDVVGGEPGSTVYATDSRSDITTEGDYDFVFGTPYSVTSGTQYSIAVYTSGGGSQDKYNVYDFNSDVYAGGNAVSSNDGGSSWVTSTGFDVYFQTYITAPNDVPGSSVLATASRSDITAAGEYDFIFSSAYSVVSSTKYAIVAYTSGGNASNYYRVSYQNTDAYADGRECSSVNAGYNWTGSNSTDLYFKTYVMVPIGDEPGGTIYATASRSDITAEGEYDFVFGTPYTVTAEANYALVIYTSSGDAANYYSISYQSSDAYAPGKECSSTDSGTNWTPNASADLYFKTYVTVVGAFRPGSTILATASRSDIGGSVQTVEFLFSSPITVTSGTRYAIVVSTTGGTINHSWEIYQQNSDVYANGNESYSIDAGSNWSTTGTDLWFKVYVDQPTLGILRSVAIPEDSATRLAVGTQFSWSDTEATDTDVKYQLEYESGGEWYLIPDGDLPGNSAGFDDGSPLDISSVLSDYGQIRLRANLYTSDSASFSTIQDWMVTYYYREYNAPEPAMTGISGEE
ncbi:choice-of-anchor R domain-containing protein, partial [Chloroflexota bacterium]